MNSLHRALRSRFRREDGVSLIELLIAITITGIIMGPIGFAFYFGLHTTTDTQNSLLESNKADLLASYFTPDVQNAVTVSAKTLLNNPVESAAACGTGAQGVLLLLTTDAGGASSVSYWRGTGTEQRMLFRRTCTSGVASPRVKVIENLDLAPPGALKTADFTCLGPGGTDCTLPTWQVVTASVTQSDSADRNVYPTTIQATRRIS